MASPNERVRRFETLSILRAARPVSQSKSTMRASCGLESPAISTDSICAFAITRMLVTMLPSLVTTKPDPDVVPPEPTFVTTLTTAGWAVETSWTVLLSSFTVTPLRRLSSCGLVRA